MKNSPCYIYSLRLLAKQDYSKFKIKKKLKSKEFTEEEIDDALNTLIQKNYIREEEYARVQITRLIQKSYSNEHIKKKLALEEIEVSLDRINKIRNELNSTEEDEIEKLIQKKLRGKTLSGDLKEKQKLKNKLIMYLMTRGHSYNKFESEINKALSKFEIN